MVNPKINPTQLDLYSSNMADIYNSLEGEIIRNIIKRLKTGSSDITEWQAQKLQELRLFNNDTTKLVSKATGVAEDQIKDMFDDVGTRIVHDVDKAMPYKNKPMPGNPDTVMRGYHNQAWEDIDNYVNQTLITTVYGAGSAQRAYQKVLVDTTAMFNTGIYTFEQSLERSVNQLAQKGIRTTLRDRGGNDWSLESYVRTVLKSTLGNSYNEVRTERMSEYGVHTVVVTSHVGAREACSVIQGNVVDLREDVPADSEYKSVYDNYWGADYGAPGGHMGINCRHLHVPFIPGVSTNNQPQYDKELNDKVAHARDTQRRIEREIVRYKKSLMISEELDSDNVGHWKRMVSKRQKAMRNHLSSNGEYLSRNYKREKVYTPLNTLLDDFQYDQ